MSSIINSFRHAAFTPLDCSNKGKPDHAALNLLEREVFENALSIYSPVGTGTHGHLFLVVDAQRYMQLTNSAVLPILPTNPGVHPNAGGTQHEIAQADRTHKDDLEQFKTCTVVEAHIKKLVLEAVPNTFIEELADTLMGFAGVSTIQILAHLRTVYGTVTPDDLKINMKNLSRQWSPDQPLEDLWKQINTCQKFAATSAEQITDAAVIRITLDNLEESGVFHHDIRDWRKRPTVEHTMPNLKAHFNAADIERIRLRSSKSAGYAQLANITNLANNASTKLNAPQPPTPSINTSPQYCWSHGLIAIPHENPHNSKTCRARLPGHCEEATLLNMMGGCNLIRGSRTRMVWKRPEKPTPPITDQAHPVIAVPV
jgi:hypothetical protein